MLNDLIENFFTLKYKNNKIIESKNINNIRETLLKIKLYFCGSLISVPVK